MISEAGDPNLYVLKNHPHYANIIYYLMNMISPLDLDLNKQIT
jgi:hypothetical protein